MEESLSRPPVEVTVEIRPAAATGSATQDSCHQCGESSAATGSGTRTRAAISGTSSIDPIAELQDRLDVR